MLSEVCWPRGAGGLAYGGWPRGAGIGVLVSGGMPKLLAKGIRPVGDII